MLESKCRHFQVSEEDEEYYLCNAYRETDRAHERRIKLLTALLAR